MQSLNDLQYESFMAHDTRYDPSSALPTYIGMNSKESAPTNAPDWVIFKYTYSDGSITRIQKARGAWDDRASLFT